MKEQYKKKISKDIDIYSNSHIKFNINDNSKIKIEFINKSQLEMLKKMNFLSQKSKKDVNQIKDIKKKNNIPSHFNFKNDNIQGFHNINKNNNKDCVPIKYKFSNDNNNQKIYNTPGGDFYNHNNHLSHNDNKKTNFKRNFANLSEKTIINKIKTNNSNNIEIEIKEKRYKSAPKFDPSKAYKNYIFHPSIVLQNVGNTNYMNIIIQCLSNIRNITIYYLENLLKIDYNKEKIYISYFYSRILFHLFPQNLNEKKYSLSKFYYSITCFNSIFKENNHNSPIDFLIYFLDRLHVENIQFINFNNHHHFYNLKQSSNNENFQENLKFEKDEDSIISQTFSWINQKEKICWVCGNKIRTLQRFFTYDLDIEYALNKITFENKNEISILECIKYVSERKTLFNIFCKKCHKKENFNIESSIYESKKILILILSDIENTKIIQKIKRENIKIKIDQILYLSGLIKSKNGNSFLNYYLFGIILYDTERNIYIAYCLSPIDKKWYKYFNEKINQVELNNFLNEYDFKLLPVILFYRHFNN